MSISIPLKRCVRAISNSSLCRPKTPIAEGLRHLYMAPFLFRREGDSFSGNEPPLIPKARPTLSASLGTAQPAHPLGGWYCEKGDWLRAAEVGWLRRTLCARCPSPFSALFQHLFQHAARRVVRNGKS